MKIPIVDEQDQIIGYKDREDRNTVDITRITGLWLWNEQKEVLLAQRSFNKSINPGMWGPAVAGTVEEGETYESNIIKEAEEEIGLKNLKPILGPKLRRTTKHAYFAQWFSATVDSSYPLVKQDSEVESIKWFSKEELFNAFDQTPEIFLPSLKDSAIYFSNMQLKVKKLHKDAKLPTHGHPGDAGVDLYTVENVIFPPGKQERVHTGIAVEIPEGHVGLIWDKSSISFNLGLKIMGGVIDAGFRGEIVASLMNTTNKEVFLEKGQKFTQILIQKFEHCDIEEVESLSETVRGHGHEGSTGMK